MAQLTLAFDTSSSNVEKSNIYIGFWTTQLNGTITLTSGSEALEPIRNGSSTGKWYKLSEIESITLEATTSGRVYVCYGDPFAPASTSTTAGMPSVIAPGSAAYYKRFDKFELTFDGTVYGVADLTAIDYWGIPMSLATELNGVAAGSLEGVKGDYTLTDIYNALEALSNPVQSQATATAIEAAFQAAGHALPFTLTPSDGVVSQATQFYRIIGPNSYPNFGDPSVPNAQHPDQPGSPPGLPYTGYNTFMEYFQYLIDTFGPGKTAPAGFTGLGNGVICQLKGNYVGSSAGSGGPFDAQTYDFSVSIDNEMNVTVQGNGSVVGDQTISITKWDLLDPAGTYGGNPKISVGGAPKASPINNLYAWLMGDLFAGLNIGAIGSGVNVNGNIVGNLSSSDWFNEAILPHDQLFDKLWPAGVTNHWNQWAAALNPMSDAYNFAYAERFSSPQLSIDPAQADTLTVILLDANVMPSA